jgi:RecJ-like exonuclease
VEVKKILSYFVYPKGDVKVCKLCGGLGTIYVWRSDLEDYDEILCPECNKKEK